MEAAKFFFLAKTARAADETKEAEALAGQARDFLQRWVLHYLENIILPVAAFVVGIFFFYGVAKYFTAFGDEAKAESAKKTITWAVIGGIVVLLAFAIVAWIGSLLGGTSPSEFKIPTS